MTPAFPQKNTVSVVTDPLLLLSIAGVVAGNLLEKQLYKSARGTFGYAQTVDGKLGYYAGKADGNADTTKPLPAAGVARQVARLGIVGACAAGIAFSPSREAQGVLLGAAAVVGAHVIQDVVPPLR